MIQQIKLTNNFQCFKNISISNIKFLTNLIFNIARIFQFRTVFQDRQIIN